MVHFIFQIEFLYGNVTGIIWWLSLTAEVDELRDTMQYFQEMEETRAGHC